MESLRISAKEVRNIINATFPDYRRKEVIIDPRTKVYFANLNWCGGSRNEYRACSIEGKPLLAKVDLNGPAPWNNKAEGMSIDLPEGAVIVEGGHFCGKVKMLRIYVNPANMPKLLNQ